MKNLMSYHSFNFSGGKATFLPCASNEFQGHYLEHPINALTEILLMIGPLLNFKKKPFYTVSMLGKYTMILG